MTAAAFQGSYADMKLVRSRKVAQIIIEIPVEYAAAFIAAFGIPDPSAEIPVAIARLNAKPEQEKPHRKFSELRPSAQAALRCKEREFQDFLDRFYIVGTTNEEDAIKAVRARCCVDSRAKLDGPGNGQDRWIELNEHFEAWRIAKGHGVAA